MFAVASSPRQSPTQYTPALRWVTTGFGMGPGGSSALATTNIPPLRPPTGTEDRGTSQFDW